MIACRLLFACPLFLNPNGRDCGLVRPAPAGYAAPFDSISVDLPLRLELAAPNSVGESIQKHIYKQAAACRNLNFFSERPFIR